MSSVYKKLVFKVPEGYFNNFDQKIAQKIDSIEPSSCFRTPIDYFQSIENQILDKIDYHKEETPSYSNYIWKAMAVASIIVLFFVNEKDAIDQNELANFFIEDYLTANNTYEMMCAAFYSEKDFC